MDDKQKKWDEVWGRYGEIDEGMRETVTALNLLGINTLASCEGHLSHGVAAAWVDVAVENDENLEELNRKADELQSAAEELYGEMENQHQARYMMGEYEKLKDEIMRKNLQEMVDLEKFLQEFYENRLVMYRVRLVINIYGRGYCRLISQGGVYHEAFDRETQGKYMLEYLVEMQEFGKFLRKKWFGV